MLLRNPLTLIGLLVAGLLLSISPALAGPPVEPPSEAGGELAQTLTVTTEPAGATVFVGGQPRGEVLLRSPDYRQGSTASRLPRTGTSTTAAY